MTVQMTYEDWGACTVFDSRLSAVVSGRSVRPDGCGMDGTF